jgi:hypothetical protein
MLVIAALLAGRQLASFAAYRSTLESIAQLAPTGLVPP